MVLLVLTSSVLGIFMIVLLVDLIGIHLLIQTGAGLY